MEQKIQMTSAEKEQLEAKLDELKLVKRPEVIERIKIARSYGDLSENSEYDAAKDEQAFIEQSIQDLENKLRYAEIINLDTNTTNKISLGKTVTYKELDTKTIKTIHIGGSLSSNIFENKISKDAPIVQAMLDHSEGDTVNVNPESNGLQYKIKIMKVEPTI